MQNGSKILETSLYIFELLTIRQKQAGKNISPVQLEGVWAISVGGLPLQILWQIDDHDGVKGAFLHRQQASVMIDCAMHLMISSTP